MPSAGNSPRKVGLAFKLALFILTGTVCIFAAGFTYNYYSSKEILLKNAVQQANYLTHSAVNRIESVLQEAGQVPDFLGKAFESAPPGKERLEQYLKAFVASTPVIYGTTAAFEPYVFDARLKRYAPYAFRKDDGSIELLQLGCEQYDYFTQDWYLVPKVLDKPMWSEPFYDEGGGNVVMSTYSVPFKRELAGAKIFGGVVTADISLDWLQEFVSEIHIFETGSAFLLSQNGVFVSAPKRERIMRDSIFSIAERLKDPAIREVGKRMIAGESGFVAVPATLFGMPCRLYYAPMPSTGWSLGVIIPEDELFADLHELSHKVIFICTAGVLLLLAVIVTISTSITRPIKLLASKTSEIARGNLDVDLPANRSNDEVGDLTRSFDNMRVALKEYISNLTETTKAKERMESELKIAKSIQMNFLPKQFPPFPHIESFTLHAALEPALEVGGDLYDFFLLDDKHLLFSVGDVSGKGVPAALFMAVTKTLVKGIAEDHMPPSEILRLVNLELCRDNEAMLFVTMFCGILNVETGEMAFSNAGHNPPLLIPKEGDISWLELPPGFFLGIMDEGVYETRTLTMQPGDKILVFTDGVTEAMDVNNQLYSDERLKQEAERLRALAPEAMDAAIMTSVHEYAGKAPQADDITVLTLEYKGGKA